MTKTKRNQKWQILHTVLEGRTMPFSSYKNCELKVKLWWFGARDGKKSAYFVTFIFSKGNFSKICVLSQCIVYWRNFQNIHTFTYQKTNNNNNNNNNKKQLLYTLLFVLKSSKVLSVSLRSFWIEIKYFLQSALH